MTEEVPYREVHELLEQHGWVLQRSVRAGDELRRVYVSEVPGAPVLIFPVRRKMVLRAHLEKIENVIQQSESDGASDD
jgi:hypothetical protein